MVGNTALFQQSDWEHEMSHAKSAGIDAFALNMAYNDTTNDIALPMAFAAASTVGFRLFFSFDYAGNGAWPKDLVASTIQHYATRPAYFHRGSQPFVSTFEGPENMTDWIGIKHDTGCFFMPDWSSIGARPAASAGIADGLFSWDAWPKGPSNMTTYPDASYYEFLKGLPYMMPVSPWFYTNMPGYNKNWLWRGDDLWFHRWQQVLALDHQPDYIEIISWNDFGESHYIGPLDEKQYFAFDIGKAPFNYVSEMPHDGWRQFLPYIISLYKTGVATLTQEGLVAWYRLNPNGACGDGGTTGNTASQLQLEYSPNVIMEDRIFYSALLTASAQVTVSINGAGRTGTWDQTPYGAVGIYHGSVAIGGATGRVVVTLSRDGQNIATVNGASLTRVCAKNLNNYNAWVGSANGPTISTASSGPNLASLNCTLGFGVYEFIGLCAFSCANGYCPSTACVCLNKGAPRPPPSKGQAGYPLPGKSIVFAGLCNFACDHGYCPDTICGKTPNTGTIPTTSPFLPPACTGGTGAGAFEGLCSFGCNYGFCPMHACTCTQTGTLIDAPPRVNTKGYYLGGADDFGLCNFACGHGYCPSICGNTTAGNGGPGRDAGPVVTLDPAVWTIHTAHCPPPCVFVFPPTTLALPTTLSFPALSTSLEVGWSTSVTVSGRVTAVFTAITVTTTILIPALTTSVISFSNFHLSTTLSGAVQSIIWPTPSISPPPFTITLNPPGVTAFAVPRTIRPPPWPYGTSYGSPTSVKTTTTSTPLPPWIFPLPPTTDTVAVTSFPTETITWVTGWVPGPTTTQIGDQPVPVIPCWAWFIWVCPPHVGGFALIGWLIPGIYPR
ncbi:putative alpha-1,3-glucanase [Coniochaeta sp. PMI_546]|nr:putative alpha-1,3-glucanase [Coniochaeta sp. PMI_546]